MEKQYDKKHKIQRLYIHWDISTQCQLKCSYCYAIKHYKDNWGKLDSWNRQQLIIKALDRSTLPIFLGLLGGEPTVHPRYLELLTGAHKAIMNHKDSRLYVTTNGLGPTDDFFLNHPDSTVFDRTYFLWSAHFEYIDKYNDKTVAPIFGKLIKHIKIMIDKGFRNKINVMLLPDKSTWKQTHRFIDELEKVKNLEIHPHFLYSGGNVHQLEHYPKEFYQEFKRFEKYPEYLVFEKNNETTVYNDYTIFNNNKTSFTGWNCYNNNYEISYDGKVNRFCFQEKHDLIKNFNFFKKIKEIKPKVCPHSSCNCDGLLKIYKEKTRLD